jgi:hypothetical protein
MADAEHELDIDQDLEFQRRDWTFERVGWIVMLLLLVAALVGLLGQGPLSKSERASPDNSLRVEYDRFERHGASAELTLFVRRDSAAGPAVSVWVKDDFLRGIQLDQIAPEPVRQVSVGDRTLFDIAVAGDSARLTLAFRPKKWGARRIELGIMGREPLTLSQFVYP